MVTIRKTTREDVTILCKIQKAAFKPLYERYHDEGNPYLRDESDIFSKLNREDSIYYTIMDNGQIVGGIFYKYNCTTPFCKMLKDGEYYLCRVYIQPDVQGKQIARTAIRLCEEGFSNAIKYFVDFPEDLEMNRRCYESVGYVDTGERLKLDKNLVLASFAK